MAVDVYGGFRKFVDSSDILNLVALR